MNKLGFSVIFSPKKDTQFYVQLLSGMLAYGCEAIEVHTPVHDTTVHDIDILSLLKKFPYRSIHASDIESYGHNKDEINYYQKLSSQINAQTITFHPHAMQSWDWLTQYFKNTVSFENMDWRKPFAKTVNDMKKIYNDYPDSSLTLDLNHLYSNDPTMALAEDFYAAFTNIAHYHISGFSDEALPHTTLHTTKQNKIISSIHTEHPIIIESLGIDDIADFRKEYDYVSEVKLRFQNE